MSLPISFATAPGATRTPRPRRRGADAPATAAASSGAATARAGPSATRRRAASAAALATLALLAGDARAATAPLSATEAARAESLARAVPWTEGATRRTRARRAPAHPLGVQTLVVEAEPRKDAAAEERRARVYQYDHARQRARRLTVDIATDRVVGTRALGSVHLPLAAAERDWALARLAADAALVAALREEQRRRGLVPFARLRELEVKASVHEPLDPSDPCARERCALLALFDRTRTAFALEPVVRFASGTIVPLGPRR